MADTSWTTLHEHFTVSRLLVGRLLTDSRPFVGLNKHFSPIEFVNTFIHTLIRNIYKWMNNNINNNNSSNNSVTTSGFSEMKRLDLFDFSSLKKRKTENL